MSAGKIAVLFGGASNESEISVITGTMCANVLKYGGEDVLCIYVTPSGSFLCGEELSDISLFKSGACLEFPRCVIAEGGVYIHGRRGKFKKFVPIYAAINCCHGGLGEGGGAGGLFAYAGIPLVGGDIFGGAAFMDKCLTKIILGGLKVNVLDYAEVRSIDDIPAAIEKIGLPAVVKPARLGSSIGISLARTENEFLSAVQSALMFDNKVLCERYVSDRREINCAAYFGGGKVNVSECEEAFSSGGLLSFDDKYAGGGKSVIPANIPASAADEIKSVTKYVYSSLAMRGIARFDFIMEGENIYLSEVNTVPGSLAWYLFAPSYKDFLPVLKELIAQAVADYANAAGRLVLKTGILASVPEGGTNIK